MSKAQLDTGNMVKIELVADGDVVMVDQSIWATPLTDDTYRIENIPIFSDLSYLDVVRCVRKDGKIEATEFIGLGGNRTETWEYENISRKQIKAFSKQLDLIGVVHLSKTIGKSHFFFLNIENNNQALLADAIWRSNQ